MRGAISGPPTMADEPACGRGMSALFEAVDVTKTFGGLTALQRVGFAVDGGIASIIGPNGAGKTTLFNVFTGLYRPDGGTVRFRGEPLVGLRPDEITARRLPHVPEHPPLRQHDRGRERTGRHARAHPARAARRTHARAALRRDRARALAARRRAARARGTARQGQRCRAEPAVRRATTARAGARARLRARPAPARRADGGHDAGGGGNADDAAPATRRRADARHRPHRAQHARGDGGLGPGHRARSRREDRRGAAARRSGRPARDRGVPGPSRLLRPRRAVVMLQLEGLDVYYGEIHALRGVALEVRGGEIVTLLGNNGAGKSTTLKTISGLLAPRRGSVVFDGRALGGVPPHQIVARGIAHVPEGRRIFNRLTVRENLTMGAYLRTDADVAADLDRAFELFPRLSERVTQVAGTLSGGEQQMLAIARALMARPRLLLLDEPSMGLAPVLVEQI